MTDTKKTKTCVVAMTHFTIDSRVRRETMAIVEDGCEVDVICLRESDPKIEISNSIVLHTMPMSKKRGGKLRYIFEYICFIIFSFFLLSWLYIRKNYSLVHIHNMPDVLVFCAIIPKFCGAKIILDIHDPMPELFMTKYCLRESSGFVRLLKFLEKISIRFSDRVLTPTKACRQLFVSRGCPINKISIIINTPDDRVFSTSDRHLWGKKPENKFVIMFHGTIAERNGLDIAVKAVNELQNEIDRLELRIYGDGDNLPNILKMISDLGIEDIVTYSGFVSFREISEA
ncbi:MAG: glycosyltransferase family 4 protein, partial [bacterium]|nr:glycosyltransferase family 4 protein [bacterium]